MDFKVKSLYTDQKLLELLRKSDEVALNILFESYFQPLCVFSFQITKDSSVAEEVVSDVFIEVWKRREYLNIHDSFKAYLFKSVRNLSLNVLKKQIRDTDLFKDLEYEYYTKTLETEFIENENKEEILKFYDCINEPAKTIFLMNREQNFTYKQIAEILQISVKTVESHMGKALKQLKEQLKKSSLRSYYRS